MYYCTRDTDLNCLDKNLKKFYHVGNKLILKYKGYTEIRVKNKYGCFYFLDGVDKSIKLPKTVIKVNKDKPKNECNIIVEGGDFSGKTTLINKLSSRYIYCKDRDIMNISTYMTDYFNDAHRNNVISRFIKDNPNTKFIFMYLNDEEELNNRIKQRGIMDELDKEALKYNLMYNRLCNYLSTLNLPNLFIIENNKYKWSDLINFCLEDFNC